MMLEATGLASAWMGRRGRMDSMAMRIRMGRCSRRRRVQQRVQLANRGFAGDQARIIQLIALLSSTAGRNNIHKGRSNSMVKQPITNGGLKADLRSFITHSSFRITDWGDMI